MSCLCLCCSAPYLLLFQTKHVGLCGLVTHLAVSSTPSEIDAEMNVNEPAAPSGSVQSSRLSAAAPSFTKPFIFRLIVSGWKVSSGTLAQYGGTISENVAVKRIHRQGNTLARALELPLKHRKYARRVYERLVALGCPTGYIASGEDWRRKVQVRDAPKRVHDNVLRVTSLNINNISRVSAHIALEYWLRHQRPQVTLLQETVIDPFQVVGYDVVSSTADGVHRGCAILVPTSLRWSVTRVHRDFRHGVVCEVDVPREGGRAKRIAFVSVYIPCTERANALQSTLALLDALQRSGRYDSVVAGGDWNLPAAQVQRTMQSQCEGFELWGDNTPTRVKNGKPDSCIDHMVSYNLPSKKHTVDADWSASDHLPVTEAFALKVTAAPRPPPRLARSRLRERAETILTHPQWHDISLDAEDIGASFSATAAAVCKDTGCYKSVASVNPLAWLSHTSKRLLRSLTQDRQLLRCVNPFSVLAQRDDSNGEGLRSRAPVPPQSAPVDDDASATTAAAQAADAHTEEDEHEHASVQQLASVSDDASATASPQTADATTNVPNMSCPRLSRRKARRACRIHGKRVRRLRRKRHPVGHVSALFTERVVSSSARPLTPYRRGELAARLRESFTRLRESSLNSSTSSATPALLQAAQRVPQTRIALHKSLRKDMLAQELRKVERLSALPSMDSRSAWQYVDRVVSGTGTASARPVRDENDVLVTDPAGIAQVWHKHFTTMFAAVDDVDWSARYHNFNPARRIRTDLPEMDADITIEELSAALKLMSNNKAAGLDGMVAELIKPLAEMCYRTSERDMRHELPALAALSDVMRHMWNTGAIPASWNNAVMVPVPKKSDDLSNVNNYRGIAIMNTFLKLFCTLINARLVKIVEDHDLLTPEQVGFRKGGECAAQVATLLAVASLRKRAGQDTHIIFIDFAKAYDTVPHEALKLKLEVLGIRGKLLGSVLALYAAPQMSVRLPDGTVSAPADVKCGVRQGDPSSPMLFNLFINDVLDGVEGVVVPGWRDRQNTRMCTAPGLNLGVETVSLHDGFKPAGPFVHSDDAELIEPLHVHHDCEMVATLDCYIPKHLRSSIVAMKCAQDTSPVDFIGMSDDTWDVIVRGCYAVHDIRNKDGRRMPDDLIPVIVPTAHMLATRELWLPREAALTPPPRQPSQQPLPPHATPSARDALLAAALHPTSSSADGVVTRVSPVSEQQEESLPPSSVAADVCTVPGALPRSRARRTAPAASTSSAVAAPALRRSVRIASRPLPAASRTNTAARAATASRTPPAAAAAASVAVTGSAMPASAASPFSVPYLLYSRLFFPTVKCLVPLPPHLVRLAQQQQAALLSAPSSPLISSLATEMPLWRTLLWRPWLKDYTRRTLHEQHAAASASPRVAVASSPQDLVLPHSERACDAVSVQQPTSLVETRVLPAVIDDTLEVLSGHLPEGRGAWVPRCAQRSRQATRPQPLVIPPVPLEAPFASADDAMQVVSSPVSVPPPPQRSVDFRAIESSPARGAIVRCASTAQPSLPTVAPLADLLAAPRAASAERSVAARDLLENDDVALQALQSSSSAVDVPDDMDDELKELIARRERKRAALKPFSNLEEPFAPVPVAQRASLYLSMPHSWRMILTAPSVADIDMQHFKHLVPKRLWLQTLNANKKKPIVRTAEQTAELNRILKQWQERALAAYAKTCEQLRKLFTVQPREEPPVRAAARWPDMRGIAFDAPSRSCANVSSRLPAPECIDGHQCAFERQVRSSRSEYELFFCDNHGHLKPTDTRSKKIAAEESERMMRGCKSLRGLLFADDLSAFAHTRTAALRAFERIVDWSERNGMRINYDKCGYMHILGQGKTSKSTEDLVLNKHGVTHRIPYVEQYKYLGLTITRNLSLTSMMEERRAATIKLVDKLRPLFVKRSTTLSMKRMVYQGMISPVLLYGCEIWATGGVKAFESNITVANNTALRAMLVLPKAAPSELFRHALGIPPLKVLIARRVLYARDRWSRSKFPVRELMTFDVATHVVGSGTFFDDQWAYVRELYTTASSFVEALRVSPGSSFTTDLLRRTAFCVGKEVMRHYTHSGRMWDRGYAIPSVASVVARQQPRHFLFVNEWLRVLCGFWKGCQQYAQLSYIDSAYIHMCPFCGMKEGENEVHYLLVCPAWHKERKEILVDRLGSPYILSAACAAAPQQFGRRRLMRDMDLNGPVLCIRQPDGGLLRDWDVLYELLRGSKITDSQWFLCTHVNAHKGKPNSGVVSGTGVVGASACLSRLECILHFIYATSSVRRPVLEQLRAEHRAA